MREAPLLAPLMQNYKSTQTKATDSMDPREPHPLNGERKNQICNDAQRCCSKGVKGPDSLTEHKQEKNL